MSHYSKFCIDKNVASKIVSLTSYSISFASLANPMSYMLHLVKITVPHSSDTVNIWLGHHWEATIMYSTNIISKLMKGNSCLLVYSRAFLQCNKSKRELHCRVLYGQPSIHGPSILYITINFTHFRGVNLRKCCNMEKVVDILKQHTTAHQDLAHSLAHIHPALNVWSHKKVQLYQVIFRLQTLWHCQIKSIHTEIQMKY